MVIVRPERYHQLLVYIGALIDCAGARGARAGGAAGPGAGRDVTRPRPASLEPQSRTPFSRLSDTRLLRARDKIAKLRVVLHIFLTKSSSCNSQSDIVSMLLNYYYL